MFYMHVYILYHAPFYALHFGKINRKQLDAYPYVKPHYQF